MNRMKMIAVAGPKGSGKDTVARMVCGFEERPEFVRVAFADELKRLCRVIFPVPEAVLWGPSERRDAPQRFPLLARSDVHFRADLVAKAVHVLVRGHRTIAEVETALAGFINRAFDKLTAEGALTPRYLLQQFGTEFGRALYEHIWIDRVAQITEHLADNNIEYEETVGTTYRTTPRAYDYLGVVVSDCRFPNEALRVRELGGEVWWIDDAKRNDRTKPPEHASEPTWESFKDVATHVIDNNGDRNVLQDQVVLLAHSERPPTGWEATALQHLKNEEYYRGLLDQIAATIGEPAYVADDGTRMEEPVRAKLPELVAEMKAKLNG